jgi:hypothetical protein
MRSPITMLCLVGLLSPSVAQAQVSDEPGAVALLDEPSLTLREAVAPPRLSPKLPMFRLELAFGYSTLLVDPDIGQGYGGGLFFGWGLHRRLGAEISIYFTTNPFTGQLANIGNSFLAGNIDLGAIIQLTRPGSRFSLTADTGLGFYLIVPVLEANTWTFGLYAGLTFAVRLTRWMGIGLKCRYHLFNLATVSGPPYRDLKSFTKVGIIDRMEIPAYVAFYF